MKSRKLTEEVILRLRQRMVVQAERAKNPAPEDVAQEYVMRLLQGLHQKATVGQAYIDIMRSIGANSRSKHYETQLKLERGIKESEKVLGFLENPVDGLTVDEFLDLERALRHIQNKRTVLIFKMLLDGHTLNEISKYLKLTESRVQQIVAKELNRLREFI